MKRTILLSIIFTCVFIVLLILPSYAIAQHPQFETAPNEIKSKFNDKQKRIEAELTSLQGNEWAGKYWKQLGLINGASFYWSPVSGFAVRSGNDFHRGVETINYGNANFSRNLLTLSPEYLVKNKHNYTISTSFVPVRWGQQHWLIPSDKLIQFIYAVNSGDYEEIDSFFVKYEDSKKPNDGLPDVPKEYRKYLNRKPIKAKVTNVKINDAKYSDYTLTLNVGKSIGVIEEMKFYLINVKNVITTIEVTNVAEHTSTARVISIGTSGFYNKEIEPAIGWRFSSKLPPLF
jgi:hypothetical protein